MTNSKPSAGQAKSTLWPLQSLNFFMADMQAGIGPFLGVFLLAHGWQSGLIGSVMTIGGVAGMIMTAPAGAVIDETTHKRLYVIIPGVCVVLASAIILLTQNFWFVAASQVATAIAGAAIGPAVNGITLGIARQSGFARQNGINQAYNHAGNMVGAGLSGFLGWQFGFAAVFWLAALFGVLSIVSVLLIPARAIDDNIARGMKDDGSHSGKASGLKVLLECKPLLILAAALACFHLGNGAMLPLYGMAVVADKQGDPASFVAVTIVVAQFVMIIVSLIAMRMAEKNGYWLILLISFIALPVRGFIAAHLISHWGVYPVQMLDGVGAGLQSVAVPGIVARILNGTGRVNVGQGAVMTVQGLGASLSPALGGWIAQGLGYGPMFMILGSFALVSIGLWLSFRSILKPAAAAGPAEDTPPSSFAGRSKRMTSISATPSPREEPGQLLAFAHIGDLHLTDAKQRNFMDFSAIVAQIEIDCVGVLDFIVLPGDNADNGLPAQYKLVSTVLKMLSLPVYAIAGDHDMEQGSLDSFYHAFGQDTLPFAVTVRGTRCLFIDICGPGGGGPDFRMGQGQLQWAERELEDARTQGEPVIVFMHAYPDDLKGDGETTKLNRLFAKHDVALVDMGHTHYNELANDGHTIFAATRSTGQIEEGPVGYSIATLDHGVVSWRFKALDDSFPFVIITSPADRRLLRSADHIVGSSYEVRALVCGSRSLKSVACQVSGGNWIEMRQLPDQRIWTASVALAATGPVSITVRAIDETGRPGRHQIEIATRGEDFVRREALGSDAATIGAWTENGIFGTQLGPNRNARPAR